MTDTDNKQRPCQQWETCLHQNFASCLVQDVDFPVFAEDGSLPIGNVELDEHADHTARRATSNVCPAL